MSYDDAEGAASANGKSEDNMSESSERQCAKCGAYEESGAVHKGRCVNCGAWLPERESSERKLAEQLFKLADLTARGEFIFNLDTAERTEPLDRACELLASHSAAIVQETLRAAAETCATELLHHPAVANSIHDRILALAPPAILERVAERDAQKFNNYKMAITQLEEEVSRLTEENDGSLMAANTLGDELRSMSGEFPKDELETLKLRQALAASQRLYTQSEVDAMLAERERQVREAAEEAGHREGHACALKGKFELPGSCEHMTGALQRVREAALEEAASEADKWNDAHLAAKTIRAMKGTGK